MTDRNHRFATRAVHAGHHADPFAGSVMPPVYQTSTYIQDALNEPRNGYEYARVQNPTREALERTIASLESAAHGAAFASGLAAIEAIVKTLSAGDHVVSEENVYGGTYRMFTQVLARLGIEFTFIDGRDPQRIEDAMRPNTKLVHLETPTNPMMRLTDLRAAVEIAHRRGARVVVDNTFASPYNQRPLELGADVVMHSTTKYLNGHSDVIGGVVVTNDDEFAEQMRFMQKATGGVPGPWDSWLVLRGSKTLPLRMKQHNANGQRIAEWLEQHDLVEAVHYPGLPSHPQHELAKRQMHGYTGMIAIELGSMERAAAMAEATRVFVLAESLGGVESLIGHPALMTHASIPEAKRDEMGVTGGLVRLSCGIEDPEDLIEDLDQALKQASGVKKPSAFSRQPSAGAASV